MAVITLKLDDEQLDLLKGLYIDYEDDDIRSPYVKALYRPQDCVISVYQSQKVVFQGKEAEYYASLFSTKVTNGTHCGSDEVGTGDYYGPICVCACLVRDSDIKYLDELAIRDSKTLSDQQIMAIVPKLLGKLTYSLLVLNNQKYNDIYAVNNMNAIKAKMHNQAYVNLSKKVKLPELMVIDQFTPEPNYYRYLKGEANIIRNITFTTKAENKYLAVACASMIARYAFLKALKDMEDHYEWLFPKGAGKNVDENAKRFIKKFGVADLSKVAKLNFKNTQRVKEDN